MKIHGELITKVTLIKGAGEKASAVAYRLHQYGFGKIVMTDLPAPLAERRTVSFCEALIDGDLEINGVIACRADHSMESISRIWSEGKIPVVADPEFKIPQIVKPDILIDGVMAKRNTGISLTGAPLVAALGPGFIAGKDVHFVVETNPASPCLGRVISEGRAEENTGVPTSVLGLTGERLLRAPAEGKLSSLRSIGDQVTKGETVGYVSSSRVVAEVSGCVWGLIRDGITIKKGKKIGDIDPRGKRELCFEITPEARTIAEGGLQGIVRFKGP